MSQHDDSDIQADWSETEMSVLRSAELDAPPRGSVERTLTAIGVGAALGAGAGVGTTSSLGGVAKASSSMVHGSMLLKWLAAAAVSGGIAGAIFVHRHPTPSAAVVPPASTVALAAPAPEITEPTATAVPPAQNAGAAPSASAATPAAPSSVAATTSHADNGDGLAAEIRLIDQARDRVRRGDAAGSLATLAEYDQLVKHGGSMRAEATVVLIEAYQKSGDSARATALGQRFLAKNPGSPYAEYVKRILSRAN